MKKKYALLPFPNEAIRNFIKYVDADILYQRDRDMKLARLSIGATPIDIRLPGKNEKEEGLYKTINNADYTYLIFIRNSCETCKAERAALEKIYSGLKKRHVQVFEVSVDDDLSFQDWKKKISSTFNYEWIQVKDTFPYAKSTSLNFDVVDTPTSYLLKNNKIIAKNISVSALDSLTYWK